MIGFCPLASGSKGNCLFLGTKKTKVLIDAGISGKSIKSRLDELDVKVSDISAIFISHEHGDHIEGLKVLSLKLDIPVITNNETARAITDHFKDFPNFKIFTTGETFEFEDLIVHPFRVRHDAVDPVGFTIEVNSLKVGVCTDLGSLTSNIYHVLTGSDILYVESNHEPKLVRESTRSIVYQDRVLSSTGHLSNSTCGELVSHCAKIKLPKRVYLAHLSQECNTPDIAKEVVTLELKKHNLAVDLTVAHQDKITSPEIFI